MKKSVSGFTIVELLVAIIVIGILAAITVVAYTGIQKRAAEGSLKSDLSNAAKQLETDRAFLQQYPASLAAADDGRGIKASKDNTLTYTLIDEGNKYCLTGVSGRSGASSFIVTSENSIPHEGACPIAAPTFTLERRVNAGVTTAINTIITRLPSHTGYVYNISDNTSFTGGSDVSTSPYLFTVTTTSIGTHTPTWTITRGCTVGANPCPARTWYVRVKAITATGESAWSATSSINTNP